MATFVVLNEANEIPDMEAIDWAKFKVFVAIPPKEPPCTVTADSGERDDALSRVLGLIRGPAARLRETLVIRF